MRFRYLVVALALFAAFTSGSWGQSNQPVMQTAPNVEPQRDKHGDEKAVAENSESGKETGEGTEYWVYRGYKVKITDGMLVLFTLALVAISLSQAIFLKGTLAATAVAADAARDQTLNFAKLERPYLYIFNASGLKIDLDQEDPFYYLKYSVANYGKTPARVECASIGINVGVAPEQPDAAIGWHDFLVSPLFVTGERRDNPTKSIPDYIEIGDYADENTGPFPVPRLKGDDEFFFWIKIKYSGPFSKDHETSACWRWDTSSHRLVLYEKHNSQT
jgi:hypothetical protein